MEGTLEVGIALLTTALQDGNPEEGKPPTGTHQKKNPETGTTLIIIPLIEGHPEEVKALPTIRSGEKPAAEMILPTITTQGENPATEIVF